MKKLIGLLFSLFTVIFSLSAQDNLFHSDEVVWFGIDFSNSKFLGEFSQIADAGEKNGEEIQVKFFPGWNNLIFNEQEKYNISKFYGFDMVHYSFETVKKVNATADIDLIFDFSKPNDLDEAKIQKMVERYNTSGKNGLGLVYIVESFNKIEEQGSVYVTFFDIATKKVLSTTMYGAAPRGIGLKNYWARVIFDVMEKSGKEFKKLKRSR